VDTGDVIVKGEALCVVSLARGGGPAQENLHGVQAAVRVKLFIELADVLTNTLLTVPGEF
jgi:hypothetical protein